uniref:Ig-like domain-containing protein n=1 Tax=Leptobrachium leishanense TaxID=445787 RepID=A0A8C5QZR4_9ANUR
MEIPGRREKVVVCDVGGFYPEAITVNWKLDGKPLDSSSRDAVRTFNKRIYSHVRPSPNNEPEDFSCEVQHETLLSPITQTHQVRYFSDQDKSCHLGLATIFGMLLALAGVGVLLWFFIFRKKYFQRFMVSPIYGPQTLNDDKVTFYCVAFNCPKATWVTWCVTEAGGDTITVSDPRTKDEEEKLLGCDYTMRSENSEDKELHKVITALNFTPSVLKHSNTTIVCRFISDGKTKEEKVKWSFTLPKPQVSGENPIALSPGDSSDVICSTELKNFNPKDIGITWSCGAGHYQDLETIKEEVTQNSQQTYDAKSECRIPGHRFTEPGFKVRVTWRHKSMEESEWKEASAADLPWCPHMSDISVPRLLHGDEVKLQCTISRYFPDALKVNWLRREAGKPDLFPVSSSDKYKLPVMAATRQEDQTFTCTASLIVNVSMKTDHGAEFICQVEHPSLESPLEKRTGELNVVGIPVVDVTLNDSQSDHWLIAEVRDFYPQNIDVRWSRTKHKGQYEEYPASDFTKESKANPDGTFQLTSKCKAKNFDDRKRFKVTVTHESLESPIEMIMMKRQDGYFITGKEGERPLPKSSSSLKKQSHPHHETTDKGSGRGDHQFEDQKSSVHRNK